MAYEDDVRRVADHLAHLITASAVVTPDEHPLVDGARRAVRRLCGQILDDLEPDNPHDGTPLAQLTEPALDALRLLLDRDRAGSTSDATSSLARASVSQTENGHHWRELHRRAILAADEWGLIYPQARPAGRDAWPIIVDVAAIAEALALAELDLEPADGAGVARPLHDHPGTLAFVAEHVRRLSPPGLSSPSSPMPSRRRHLLLAVRSISDTPAAAARLVFLMHSAQRVRPESVRAIARGHAENLLRVTKLLEEGRRPDGRSTVLIAGLRKQAAELQEIASEAQNYRALEPDDPRPLQQLQLIRDSWRRPGPISEPTRLTALRFIHPALAVVTALHDVIEQQVDNGHWYIRSERGLYPWQRTNASTRPPIFDLVQRAVTHADELASLVQLAPYRSAIMFPRDILADHLRARDTSVPPTIGG